VDVAPVFEEGAVDEVIIIKLPCEGTFSII
jgi:hypothetical protein